MKFRKKPVVIDAEQWFKNGDGLRMTNPEFDSSDYKHGTTDEMMPLVVKPYTGVDIPGYYPCPVCGVELMSHGQIKTLESGLDTHIVCPKDWIIKGVNGEYYACKPDIFEKSYEPAE